MELVKKIFFILIVLLYGCKQSSNTNIVTVNTKKVINDEEVINKKDVIKVPKSIIKENLLNCFTKENEIKHIEDDNLFVYKDFSLGLSFDVDSQMNSLIYEKGVNKYKYLLEKDDYDQPDFDIKVYILEETYVYILETIDYYSSVIYIYIYIDGVLTRLGDTSIDQPNVEDTGIKKESFKICKENDTILLESYLDNKLYSTHKLKIEKKNVVKKAEK